MDSTSSPQAGSGSRAGSRDCALSQGRDQPSPRLRHGRQDRAPTFACGGVAVRNIRASAVLVAAFAAVMKMKASRMSYTPILSDCAASRLACIFHSFHRCYDHFSARVTSASGGRRICGLSPDVPASKLGSRVGYSLQAGYRLECETSGLGASSHG